MSEGKAEELLAEVKKLATARLSACSVAAKHEGLVLVSAARLSALEDLAAKVKEAMKRTEMTRDYRDVQHRRPDYPYLGKKFLVDRPEGNEVWHASKKLDRTK